MKIFLLHFYILQVTIFNAHEGFKQQPSRFRDIDHNTASSNQNLKFTVKSSGYRVRRHFKQRIQGDQVTP